MAPEIFRLRAEIGRTEGPPAEGLEVAFESQAEASAALAKIKSHLLASGREVYELGRSTQDTRVVKLLERLQKQQKAGKP